MTDEARLNRLEQALTELAENAISGRQELKELAQRTDSQIQSLTTAVSHLGSSIASISRTMTVQNAETQTQLQSMAQTLETNDERYQARFVEVVEAVELMSRAASQAVETSRDNAQRFETLRQDAISDRQRSDERFAEVGRRQDAALELMQTMLVELGRTNGRVEALEDAA